MGCEIIAMSNPFNTCVLWLKVLLDRGHRSHLNLLAAVHLQSRKIPTQHPVQHSQVWLAAVAIVVLENHSVMTLLLFSTLHLLLLNEMQWILSVMTYCFSARVCWSHLANLLLLLLLLWVFLFNMPTYLKLLSIKWIPPNWNMSRLLKQKFCRLACNPVGQPTAAKHWRLVICIKLFSFGCKT